MAKGRRLTSTRSERLLGLGTFSYGGAASEEFGEDDVWSMVEHASENHHHRHHQGGSGEEWTPRAGAAAAASGRRHGVTSTRERHIGGLSSAFEDKTTSSTRIVHQFSGGRHVATSAPVSVPDWSKIYRVNSSESMHESDEDDRVGDSGMEPPHEYLARSRKMHAMSVFEGVGRTLKGRDMSRVRDAVWSQTGFEG